MSTSDTYEVVSVVELLRNILSERVASTSGRDTPTTSIIRVRPKEIADGAFMRNFLNSIQLFNLVKGVNTRRKTTVKTEYGVVYDCSQG